MDRRQQEMLEKMTSKWLAEHEPKPSPKATQRIEWFEGRKQAREQQRQQERRALARPLLRGV